MDLRLLFDFTLVFIAVFALLQGVLLQEQLDKIKKYLGEENYNWILKLKDEETKLEKVLIFISNKIKLFKEQ